MMNAKVGVRNTIGKITFSLRMALVVMVFYLNQVKTVVTRPIFPNMSKKSNLELVSKRERKKTAEI